MVCNDLNDFTAKNATASCATYTQMQLRNRATEYRRSQASIIDNDTECFTLQFSLNKLKTFQRWSFCKYKHKNKYFSQAHITSHVLQFYLDQRSLV